MSHQLTDVQRDAIGYLGGSVLAVCLIPQVVKVLVTRSARDISIVWSLLYTLGTTLSLAYLILKDAPAAWIPLIFEIGGCLCVLALKLFYERTACGRRYSAAKQQQHMQQQQQQLELERQQQQWGGGSGLVLPAPAADAAARGLLHHRGTAAAGAAGAGAAAAAMSPRHQQHGHNGHPHERHSGIAAALGHAAAAAAASASGDISWRGSAVLGLQQHEPDASTAPMLDVSVRSGRAFSGAGAGSAAASRDSSWRSSRQEHGQPCSELVVVAPVSGSEQQQCCVGAAGKAPAAEAGAPGLLFECGATCTSTGSRSRSSISDVEQAGQWPAAAGGVASAACQQPTADGRTRAGARPLLGATQSAQQQSQQQQSQQQSQQQQQQQGSLFASGWRLRPALPVSAARKDGAAAGPASAAAP